MRRRPILTAEEFLDDAAAFQLGELPTEAPHPKTATLSTLARTDLPAAIRAIGDVDRAAVSSLEARLPELAALAVEIRDTLDAGDRIFLCGCGATGRMALALESIWRKSTRSATRKNAVRSFMAGGDVGLIHSVEDFEDRPEFGARMLREAGFRRNDLLIACTEGGETPFVIGATERAARTSRRRPFFLHCNPDALLRARVERSRRVLENPAIRSISLFVGPMALAGSTRMQATTVLMLAVGHGLLSRGSLARMTAGIREATSRLAHADFAFLAPFVEAEHRIYERGQFIAYESRRYALTVLTDTTERSPTFSLRAFENRFDKTPRPSLSFLSVAGAATGAAAWRAILGRPPRPLTWPKYRAVAGAVRVRGFDLSRRGLAFRRALAPGNGRHHLFRIEREGAALGLSLDRLRHRERLTGLDALNEQVYVKLLLNTHSLLVMGRLGRYEGNLMTWVKPSNRKLVDRAIRYVRLLLEARGHTPRPSYEETARVLLQQAALVDPEESIVLRTMDVLVR